MPYDQKLAQRLRDLLTDHDGIDERKMFGGLCFLVNGNMLCGVESDHLMVRVGPRAYDDALARPHARPMDLTGRPMKGLVWVDPPGLRDKRSLRRWLQRVLAFAGALPPKP